MFTRAGGGYINQAYDVSFSFHLDSDTQVVRAEYMSHAFADKGPPAADSVTPPTGVLAPTGATAGREEGVGPFLLFPPHPAGLITRPD